MGEKGFGRLDSLFHEVAALPAVERPAFLERLQAAEPALRAALQKLLDADGVAPLVFDGASASGGSGATAARLAAGTRIGRYEIKRVLGAGGMGAVYEAVQENPRRRVALKVMREDFVSHSLLRRFQHEAHVLGNLQHPGIAQIYEAGTHTEAGRTTPYFALEYVDGARTLTGYANAEQLGVRARVALLARVCAAVGYGHQRGILHRDLKPANILVDARGEPKVIDFGVARSTNSDLALTTLATTVGQLVGTLQYMSPEQCAGDPGNLDTRTDVYSLGIVAFELLADALPYEVSSTNLLDATRAIREAAPRRLSALRPKLRGDLETIVLKALSKEPALRYSSATEMGEDLERYLRGDPIQARPPSLGYQLATVIRRHRALSSVVAGAIVALIVASIVSFSFGIGERAKFMLASKARSVALIAAAQPALEQNDSRSAQELLDRVDIEHRRWEWDYLHSRLDMSSDLLRMEGMESSKARAVAIRPDGAILVAWSDPIANGQPHRSIELEVLEWTGNAFTISARNSRTLSSPSTIDALAISSDGNAIAWAAYDTLIVARIGSDLVLEAETPPDIPRARIHRLCFSPASPGLLAMAIGNEHGPHETLLIDLGDWHFTRLTGHTDVIRSIAFSNDGTHVASASEDQTARIWRLGALDPSNAEPTAVLLGHRYKVHAVAFSPDSCQLATGGGDSAIKLWDVAKSEQSYRDAPEATGQGVEIATLRGHRGPVLALAYHPDGDLLYSAGDEQGVGVWNLSGATVFQRGADTIEPVVVPDYRSLGWMRADTDETYSLDFVQGGRGRDVLLSTHQKERFRAWYVRPPCETLLLPGHTSSVTRVEFNAAGSVLASTAADGTIVLWDVVAGLPLRRFPIPHIRRCLKTSLSFHPEANALAVGTHAPELMTSRVHLLLPARIGKNGTADWAHASWTTIASIDDNASTHVAVLFTRDGSRLISSLTAGTISCWVPGADGWSKPQISNKIVVPGEEAVSLVELSNGMVACGSRMAAGSKGAPSESGAISTFRVNGTEAMWHTPLQAPVTVLACDRAQRRLAVGLQDGMIQLWDVAEPRSPELRAAWASNEGGVLDLAFHSDGDRLAVTRSGGPPKLLDTETGLEAFAMRDIVTEARGVRFSPDGSLLAATSMGSHGSDNAVRVWQTPISKGRAVVWSASRARWDAAESMLKPVISVSSGNLRMELLRTGIDALPEHLRQLGLEYLEFKLADFVWNPEDRPNYDVLRQFLDDARK